MNLNSSESLQAGSATALQHADKYNDPRAKITQRGIMIGVAVALLGAIGAAGSIYARKTQLEKTTRFWGQETITALQLAERIELLPRGSASFEPVELTGTPGLGHLRRIILDERNYDWTTESESAALQDCDDVPSERPNCVQLRLTDPTGKRVGTVEIDIDLTGGWLGPGDGSGRIRASERVRPKFGNYFATIITVKQKRYDHRD